jgi:hypothetical protein
VFLEQGVGDRFLHLAHIKAQHPKTRLTFAVVDRWRPVLSWLFPDDDVAPLESFSLMPQQIANASGDYLAEAYAQTASLAPQVHLGQPVKLGFPKFGVVWRGGAAGNKRDERSINLAEMLDWLGDDIQIVVLQPNITADEKETILAQRNAYIPAFDVTNDFKSYVKLISGLAGVIGIDNSAVHVAGVFGIPSFTFMHPSAHWYWGRTQEVSTVYHNAKTVSLGSQDSQNIARWMEDCQVEYSARAPAIIQTEKPFFSRPVFVAGCPRSGTSLTMGLLQRCGLWVGRTVPGGPSNPDGFFENIAIREKIVKPLLKDALGCDPLGVTRLPAPAPKYVLPDFHERVLESIKSEGYSGNGPWGYKDAKMTLVWNLWADAFPDATWVIVSRNRQDVVRSCLKTRFMAQHSHDEVFWRHFHEVYTHRLDRLRSHLGAQVYDIRYEEILKGDFSILKTVCARARLDFDLKIAQGLVRSRA